MIDQVLSRWTSSPLAPHFSLHQTLPPRPAQLVPFPAWVDPRLQQALARRGCNELYRHQRACAEALHAGRDVVVATPTASGKTLCYNLPVFNCLLAEREARALYLFPTKALARDQIEEARRLAATLEEPELGVAVYDGDTPPDQRRAARRRARLIATNPEMLHRALLPHHPSWAAFLSGLRYVIIDELHTYRGVFGSHLAHVLRRLQRLANFHGAQPRFIATSATIANPEELAAQLFGRPSYLIDENGAPSGERHLLIYNPPLVDAALGLRESSLRAACVLVRDLVEARVSTLVFCRSRLTVEVMVRELRDILDHREAQGEHPARVRGYRGGYLPERRRDVEHALRLGDTDVVVTTSALELGIDIGGLDAVVLVGWPGSRAALWQRAGRAGRRLEPSLAVLVASSEPVDQFVAQEPNYVVGQAPEHARINPENPAILVPQLKCAAAELPFAPGERYGSCTSAETDEILGCLAEAKLLHRSAVGYHYVGHPHPAGEVQLRGHFDENFLVVQQPAGQVLAEVDYHDAPQVLHEQAIYQLEGRQYQVLQLDHAHRKAYVQPVTVDYYTDAMTHTAVRILERSAHHGGLVCHGEVHVVHRVLGFKKIKLHTRENVGYGEVTQPERQMHTTAIWLNLPAALVAELERSPAEIISATLGAAYALHSMAALLLMSDPRDLSRAVGDARSGWFAVSEGQGRGPYARAGEGSDLIAPPAPTIFLFDRYPGGIGLSERLFEERHELLARSQALITRCGCREGCPACIGPAAGRSARELAAGLLALIAKELCLPRSRPAAAALISASPG